MPKKKVGGKKKGVRCDDAAVTPSCRPASPMPLTHPYHSVGISRAYSTFSSPHPRTGCQEGDREEDSCQQEQGASLASRHYFRHSPPLGSCLPSDSATGCSSLHAASIIRSPCPRTLATSLYQAGSPERVLLQQGRVPMQFHADIPSGCVGAPGKLPLR